jgi:hypothetical protein
MPVTARGLHASLRQRRAKPVSSGKSPFGEGTHANGAVRVGVCLPLLKKTHLSTGRSSHAWHKNLLTLL